MDEVLTVCRNIYTSEICSVTKDDLAEANPDYN